jgi:4-hydroxy-tetrahydrodipicolinate reductase
MKYAGRPRGLPEDPCRDPDPVNFDFMSSRSAERAKMKVALLGYGKMGKLVEALAAREEWEVGPILDVADNKGGKGISLQSMRGVDVAIDFSQPDAVLPNLEACAQLRINMVVGTTGWGEERSRAERLVLASGIGLVHAANFSLGMNLFFEIVRHAAQMMVRAPQYDAYILEQHHRTKKDKPSGSAIRLLDIMKTCMQSSSLDVASTRAGFIPGNHIVGFDSEADSILLEHRARNRTGFAEGAILAARWIQGKRGFFEFGDVVHDIVGLA